MTYGGIISSLDEVENRMVVRVGLGSAK